jgi:hypothetical protein
MQPLFPSSPTPPAPPMPPVKVPVNVGDACSAATPCAGGGLCLTQFPGRGNGDIPGGYCTLDCKSTPCPLGSVCQDFGKDRYCVLTCDDSCARSGLSCCERGSADVCLPSDSCSD